MVFSLKLTCASSCPKQPYYISDYTGFHLADIMQVARLMVGKVGGPVLTVFKRPLNSVQNKYREARFEEVAERFDPPEYEDLLVD